MGLAKEDVFSTIENFNETQFYKQEDKSDKFQHNEFGDYLIEKYHIVHINNRLHIYDNGIYVNDERLIKRAMVKEISIIKRIQQSEVMEYLKNTALVSNEEPAHLIPLKNGVYDIKNEELLQHSPNLIFTARFNVSYDPNATSEVVDQALRMIACDNEVFEMFKQMFGYLLYKKNFIGKSFLFVGKGGNGKSLILEIMQALVGMENTASVPLQGLNEQFNVSSLYHKLLNAGDDIPLKSVEDASNFKKLTTGEPVLASYKGQDVFEFKNHAKLVFSANGIPRWYENSDGVFDRLIIVPFNNRIRGTDKEDKNMDEKVTTEEAKSHTLNLALQGLREVLKNNNIIMPNVVKDKMQEFKKTNDPLEAFIAEYSIESKRATDVYEDYRDWSEFEGYKYPFIRKEFRKQIEARGYIRVKRRIPNYNTSQWTYVHEESISD